MFGCGIVLKKRPSQIFGGNGVIPPGPVVVGTSIGIVVDVVGASVVNWQVSGYPERRKKRGKKRWILDEDFEKNKNVLELKRLSFTSLSPEVNVTKFLIKKSILFSLRISKNVLKIF